MNLAKGDLVHYKPDPRSMGVMRICDPSYSYDKVTVDGGAVFDASELQHVRYGFNMTAEHIEDIQVAMAGIVFSLQHADTDKLPGLERAYQFFGSMIDLPVVTTDGTQEGRNVQN